MLDALRTRRQFGLSLAAVLAGCSARPTTPALGFTLLDGTTGHTSQWAGRVMLVNFWATTCVSCVREMPQIAALHRRFAPQGYDTLAVSMAYDPPARVVRFAESRQLPFGVAIDNTGAIARGFGDVRATPTSFLIDRRGRIVEHLVGTPDFDALAARVSRLLAQA